MAPGSGRVWKATSVSLYPGDVMETLIVKMAAMNWNVVQYVDFLSWD